MRRLVFTVLLGCGVPAGVMTPETAQRLDVHPVEWNPRHEHLDAVTGALDLGGDVVVFTKTGTAVLSDGVANVSHDELRAGAIVPAPDGSGTWITAIDPHGRVFRLRARKRFEPVSDRYGLEGKTVQRLTGFGGRYTAFSLGSDVAIADGASIFHFGLGETSPLALDGGGTRTWVARAHDVVALDAPSRTSRSYAIEGARVAVDTGGHAWIAGGRAVYEAGPDDKLVLRYVADAPVRSLTASNDHVWLVDGNELVLLSEGRVARTHGAHFDADADTLMGSSSGDVWSIDGHGALHRWAVGAAASGRPAWKDAVAPVFARSCASCHGPEGSSGIDLSNDAAWTTKRDVLRRRLVADRDMPPKGHPLSDEDRAALRAFLQ